MQPGLLSSAETAQGNAAQRLLQCLQQLGERHSNPVLEVLGDVSQVEKGRQFPQPALQFAGAPWRAYYHCHRDRYHLPNEHGHFHLFAKLGGDDDWSHVAALSMDAMGQPLRWFTVNLWVTRGLWREAPRLVPALSTLSQDDELMLVEQWLGAMLGLYADELPSLLQQRDAALNCHRQHGCAVDVLADRELYILSEQPINLADKLGDVLCQQQIESRVLGAAP
jgi:hypothetical protein